MKVFTGADHRGYDLKNQVREHLQHRGFTVEDEGALTEDKQDDYPKYAYAVATKLLGEEEDQALGVLVCGSGQGMAIAANKVRGIRAAVCWSPAETRAARHDDDVNILVLPSDMLDTETALAIVDDFVDTKFSGEERHRRRLEQIEELYG